MKFTNSLILTMIAATVTMSSVCYLKSKEYSFEGSNLSTTQLKNIVALSDAEEGGGNSDPGVEEKTDPESIPTTREECLKRGGNWNMASVVQESGFLEDAACEIEGEITILGFTIKGSYKKGGKYTIPWASYVCKESDTNCCIKQGLYSGETKLA